MGINNKRNIYKHFAELSEAWFATGEKDFAERLLKYQEYQKIVDDIQKEFTIDERRRMAEDMMFELENGQVKTQDQAESYEALISAYLYRDDATKVLVKVKYDEEPDRKTQKNTLKNVHREENPFELGR